MHHPKSLVEWADEIEIILGDGDLCICPYNNSHKELGWQEMIHNKLRDISNNVDTFIKALEVLGIDKDWIQMIKEK